MNLEIEFGKLRILHIAMLAGAAIICTLMGYLMREEAGPISMDGALSGLMPVATAVMVLEIAMSNLLWRQRQSHLPDTKDPLVKMTHYRAACILRWACLQGGILIVCLLGYVEKTYSGYPLIAIGLILLYLAGPSKDYLTEHYGLQF